MVATVLFQNCFVTILRMLVHIMAGWMETDEFVTAFASQVPVKGNLLSIKRAHGGSEEKAQPVGSVIYHVLAPSSHVSKIESLR